VGLVIAIFINVVNWFVLPSEIGNMYARAGESKPVSGVTGFWNLIPLVGLIIWLVKVQHALNRRWETAAI
jgi:divalent metal cation (Fe/Co/Zn/Cd) transporter